MPHTKKDFIPNILVIEHDSKLLHQIEKTLEKFHYNIIPANNGHKALSLINSQQLDLMLLDYELPDMPALDIIYTLSEKRLTVPFIVLAGHGDIDTAVNVMRLGAKDYIIKSDRFLDLLPQVIQRALDEIKIHKQLSASEKEKEKIQHQLLQSQKMEAIGVLAGGIAHDFNNMLTVMLGHIEMALLNIDESLPLYLDLKETRQAAHRAADLTRQLLLFSKKQPVARRPLNLNTTIEDLLVMLQRMIGEDITINTQLETTPWTILADPGNIEQILMNLTINARDAMSNGGRLSIKTENTELSPSDLIKMTLAHPGKYLRLSISDTGIGMNEDLIAHIFEPFFSTKEKRTGLGLAVVYGIISQHEGWIEVHSSPGQGTTFYIYLPAIDSISSTQDGDNASIEHIQGQGEHVLLVEDQPEVRKFCQAALNSNGYTVTSAENAEKAKAIFFKNKKKFDLIISDVVLPDQNGVSLVEELHSFNPQIKIILSSGYTDHKALGQTIKERGFLFLQKPYALSDLLNIIHKCLAGENNWRPKSKK